MLYGNNGILQRATDAKTKSDETQIKERILLAYHSALTGGQGSCTKDDLEKELSKEFGDGFEEVDDSSDTNWILKAKGQSVIIPAGRIVKQTGFTAKELVDRTFATDSEKKEYYSSLYGSVVNNYEKIIDTSLTDETSDTWKIFFVGTMGEETENHIYLISDSYVKYTSLPSKTLNSTIYKYKENGEWKAFFASLPASWKDKDINDGILPAYVTGTMIETRYATESRIKNLNYNYYHQNYSGESQVNMRMVAGMLDTNLWSIFMDSTEANSKAEYAIGGPTIEMLLKSYNQTHGTDYAAKAINEKGYRITKTPKSDTEWWTGIQYMLGEYGPGNENKPDTNGLYISETSPNNAVSYWIASPCGDQYSSNMLLNVDYSGSIGSGQYTNSLSGFRPIICLKSNTKLQKVKDGEYRIVN